MAREDSRRPLPTPQAERLESAVEEAMRRGDFDDLPGAGRPLDMPDTHDPDWWIKRRFAEGDVDRDALLPVVMLLRREFDRREDTFAAMTSEQEVREYAQDFTRRVHQDRRDHPLQAMMAPEMDPETAVRRWRLVRAARRPAPAPTEPVAPPAPRRRFWRRRRRS